jgi:hypothetical protein
MLSRTRSASGSSSGRTPRLPASSSTSPPTLPCDRDGRPAAATPPTSPWPPRTTARRPHPPTATAPAAHRSTPPRRYGNPAKRDDSSQSNLTTTMVRSELEQPRSELANKTTRATWLSVNGLRQTRCCADRMARHGNLPRSLPARPCDDTAHIGQVADVLTSPWPHDDWGARHNVRAARTQAGRTARGGIAASPGCYGLAAERRLSCTSWWSCIPSPPIPITSASTT